MKKHYPQIVSAIIILIVLLPTIASAAIINGVDYGLLPCDGVKVPCTFDRFADLINAIINWFLTISVSVAAITFAYAGAQMLLHPEEAGKKEEAKEMFRKTVYGMIIILGAWLVIHTVVAALVNPNTGALRFLQG